MDLQIFLGITYNNKCISQQNTFHFQLVVVYRIICCKKRKKKSVNIKFENQNLFKDE